MLLALLACVTRDELAVALAEGAEGAYDSPGDTEEDTVDDTAGDTATFTDLAVGWSHACAAMTEGGLQCWGVGDDGATEPPDATLHGLCAGLGYTCGLSSAGIPRCWGLDESGVVSEAPDTAFDALTCGRAHACGFGVDMEAWCWGADALADGFNTEIIDSGSGRMTWIDAGSHGTVGITEADAVVYNFDHSSSLYAFPDGAPDAIYMVTIDRGTYADEAFCTLSDGVLGNCDGLVAEGDEGQPETSPPEDATFRAVDPGESWACGLIEADDDLRCWGSAGADTGTPWPWIEPPEGAHEAVHIGLQFGCALRTDGGVDCWGTDAAGSVTDAP